MARHPFVSNITDRISKHLVCSTSPMRRETGARIMADIRPALSQRLVQWDKDDGAIEQIEQHIMYRRWAFLGKARETLDDTLTYAPGLVDLTDAQRIAELEGTQSEGGSRYVERMLTVSATLRKQERNVLDFLVAAVHAKLSHTTPPSLLPSQALAGAA